MASFMTGGNGEGVPVAADLPDVGEGLPVPVAGAPGPGAFVVGLPVVLLVLVLVLAAGVEEVVDVNGDGAPGAVVVGAVVVGAVVVGAVVVGAVVVGAVVVGAVVVGGPVVVTAALVCPCGASDVVVDGSTVTGGATVLDAPPAAEGALAPQPLINKAAAKAEVTAAAEIPAAGRRCHRKAKRTLPGRPGKMLSMSSRRQSDRRRSAPASPGLRQNCSWCTIFAAW